jgi:hypothetical protein
MKNRIISAIQLALREGWRINSKRTVQEMLTFVKTGPGSYGAQYGCYDDAVISYGIGVFTIASGLATGLGKTFTKEGLREMMVK